MHGENQSGAKLNTSLLVRGAILFGLGGVLAGIGMLIGAVAVSSAARNWVRQLDTPPSETAKSVAKRLSAAGSAGAKSLSAATSAGAKSLSAATSAGASEWQRQSSPSS